MGTVLTYTALCGAAVNFSDEGYINSTGQELDFRRENMMSTAVQIAQENQLRQLRGERPSNRESSERR